MIDISSGIIKRNSGGGWSILLFNETIVKGRLRSWYNS